MRRAYIASLESYEGTRYVWGGENSRGIDCSGLVRRGLINADFHEGVVTANPG
ncbi:MAG: NlpC/P60 family protein, partial [Pyrinomonadaceae bacterium]